MPALYKSRAALLCVFSALLFLGCSRRSNEEIHFMRLERVIMDTSDALLADSLTHFRDRFGSPLLHLYPEDEQFMAMVAEYRNDPVIHHIDSAVRQRYSELGDIERELGKALSIAGKESEGTIKYTRFATFIGANGYTQRVMADKESHSLVLAIDQYVLPQMESMGYFGDPLYIVHLSDSAYIAADCMATIAEQHIAVPPQPWTLLDYIIAEGKKQYLLDLCLPHCADTIKLRYTEAQLHWMQQNEAKVWAYLIQNKLLFNNDATIFHNLIDEAPKTNAFGAESAPRTIDYIGRQIVSQYMKHSNTTLVQLLEQTDARQILNKSGYRPK